MGFAAALVIDHAAVAILPRDTEMANNSPLKLDPVGQPLRCNIDWKLPSTSPSRTKVFEAQVQIARLVKNPPLARIRSARSWPLVLSCYAAAVAIELTALWISLALQAPIRKSILVLLCDCRDSDHLDAGQGSGMAGRWTQFRSAFSITLCRRTGRGT